MLGFDRVLQHRAGHKLANGCGTFGAGGQHNPLPVSDDQLACGRQGLGRHRLRYLAQAHSQKGQRADFSLAVQRGHYKDDDLLVRCPADNVATDHKTALCQGRLNIVPITDKHALPVAQAITANEPVRADQPQVAIHRQLIFQTLEITLAVGGAAIDQPGGLADGRQNLLRRLDHSLLSGRHLFSCGLHLVIGVAGGDFCTQPGIN